MKRIFLTAAIVGVSSVIFAQDQTPIKYAQSITVADATKKLSVLAADDFAGRETGNLGAQKAADYIKNHFKSLGLKAPVNGDYFQKLDLREQYLSKTNVIANGEALEFFKDFYISGVSQAKLQKTFKNFVFVGYGIASEKYDDLSNLNLEGKVAIVLAGEPSKDGKSLITANGNYSDWTSNRTKKIDALKAKKPQAIIIVSDQVNRMSQNGTHKNRPALMLGDAKSNTPIIYLTKAALSKLMGANQKDITATTQLLNTLKPASFTFNGNLDVDVELTIKPLEAHNVLGFLEGTDEKLKKEVVVITAHYDHIGVADDGDVYNGADDDASGTAGVMELAEAFVQAKKEGKGPKRSILFMTVVGEEKGLLGSEWYSRNPIFPLANTITNLNIDMIGRVGDIYKNNPDSANYIFVIGSDKLSTTLKEISEKANRTYSKMVLDYRYDDPSDPNRFYYRSDHYNFAKHNIPVIFYFNGTHEDYHKKTDEIGKINFPLLVKRAQLVFYTAWDLLNRAERPVVDRQNDMPSNR